MPQPSEVRSAAAWKMSVPTILCARSGNTTSNVRPKKTPLPTDVKPTTNPPKHPDQHSDDAITTSEDERRVTPGLRSEEGSSRAGQRL